MAECCLPRRNRLTESAEAMAAIDPMVRGIEASAAAA
jgi:hypothetical protein